MREHEHVAGSRGTRPGSGGRDARTSIVDRLDDAFRPRAEAVQRALRSPVRTPRMTVVIGRLLGPAFVVCFGTGIYSHLLQTPLPWLPTPSRPEYLYAWTQGTHVVVGSMLIPLLLAKLWVVYPNLFRWPPIDGVPSLLERASVAVLVATALVMPITGVLNVLQVYPWDFSFRRVHFALAWLLIGALFVHIAVQLPVIRRHWTRATGATNAAATAESPTSSASTSSAEDDAGAVRISPRSREKHDD